ncbi:MAG: cupin domain-containing protein [Candidatus Bathyarchaeia archaeon]|nr:cupin domain-containing protein [Candidatus Bathyarchaeota archaeon]
MKPIVRYERDVGFSGGTPFPAKILLSKSDTPTASVRLSVIEKGKSIELHAHGESDQIEYCIRGRAIMFIEGLGEKEVFEGTFTYIPRGVRHSLVEVIEPLIVLTVFVPPLF